MESHSVANEADATPAKPRSRAAIAVAAADTILAARHARGLQRSLAEIGDRGHAHAVDNIVRRLDRAIGALADG